MRLAINSRAIMQSARNTFIFATFFLTQNACSFASDVDRKSFNDLCQAIAKENAAQRLPYRPDYLFFYKVSMGERQTLPHADYSCAYVYCEFLQTKLKINAVFDYEVQDISQNIGAGDKYNATLPPGSFWPERVQRVGLYTPVYEPQEICDKLRDAYTPVVPILNSKHCVYMTPIKLQNSYYYKIYSHYVEYNQNVDIFLSDFYSSDGRLVATVKVPEATFGGDPTLQVCSRDFGILSDEFANTISNMITLGGRNGEPK